MAAAVGVAIRVIALNMVALEAVMVLVGVLPAVLVGLVLVPPSLQVVRAELVGVATLELLVLSEGVVLEARA